MPMVLAFAIVAVSVIAITFKTYVGYGEYSLVTKMSFLVFLIFGWCSPFIVFSLRHSHDANQFLIKFLYFIFGFVFFLFVISMVRDFIWFLVEVSKKIPLENMSNSSLLKKVNIITILVSLLICFYGVYEAEKDAAIKTHDIVNSKIKKDTKIVMLTDLHIDTSVGVEYVKNLVNRVNSLNADIITIVGDVVDSAPHLIENQLKELAQLKAKYGVYIVAGNHEYYSGGVGIYSVKFKQLGFNFLVNEGQKIGDTGIYVAGIPDVNSSLYGSIRVDALNAIKGADQSDYVVMLSHTPKVAADITSKNVDIILSGHTHGGQMFPFHYFVKQANENRLAGFYNINGVNMYISRGTRYWGPPMRVLAPSEVTIFNMKSK